MKSKKILTILISALLTFGLCLTGLACGCVDPENPPSGDQKAITMAISASAEKLTVKLNSSEAEVGNKTAKVIGVKAYEYFKGDNIKGLSENVVSNIGEGTIVGDYKLGTEATLEIDRYKDNFDMIYNKYYVVLDDTILKGPIYTTEIEAQVKNNPTLDLKSKKGLLGENANYFEDLNCSYATLNFDIERLVYPNEIIDENGEAIELAHPDSDFITFDSNGKTYYFRKSVVDWFDKQVNDYYRLGAHVTAILYAAKNTNEEIFPRKLTYYPWSTEGTVLMGFNSSNSYGFEYYVAIIEFLSNRYTTNNFANGYIGNFVVENEIDYAKDYNRMSEKQLPLETYMEEYSRLLRLTNLAAKKYHKDITVSVPFTQAWSEPGYTIKPATAVQAYAPKAMIEWLNNKTKAEGDSPLQGVTFLVTESNGQVVGSSNGEFVTDENGRIVIEGLEPGVTIIAKEIRTLEGYVLDSTPKSIKIEVGDAQTLRFFNAKQGTIVIRKLDKQTNEPLAGVEFQITYSDGSYLDDDYGHLSSKGLYKTDANGENRISGVVGTLVITETKPLPGYVMDEGTKTQTVRVNATDTQTITVYNTRIGGLTIIKKDEETGARIKGVEFEVRKLNGEIIGTYTTDARGAINLPQAEKGWYQVVELKAAKGYKLDDTPHQIEVKDGGTATLEITNRQSGSALIHKIDSVTGKGIYGVKFLLSDAKGNPVGTYESDNEGYVYIDKELADGRYTIREIECAGGYILDTQPKTIYVEYGGCTTITWKNTAITGQIQVWKKSADDNAINGFPAGTPLEGAVFEIYDKANRLVDTIKSDSRGLAVSKQLPLGRYTLKEVTSPAYYSPASEAATVYLEHEGQIVQIEVLNKSVYTHVSVRKSGYTQVVPGQSIRYTFKEIGNNSTVSLDNFFWRDTLPTDAVRLDKIITGTWSAKLTYKAVFRTNVNGEYRTLADNLDTQRSYTLDASPAALGLASNEYVTEVMFLFGRVPAGFKQMQTPYIYCNVLSSVAHEYRFANKTDVGGTWQGQWIMANDRWVTIVYRGGPTPTLPRTGY